MKNPRFLLAILLAVVGNVCVLAPAHVSAAASTPTSAWWSRVANPRPTDEVPAALPVPAPESPAVVPAGAAAGDGQLVVESTPEGAVAIAAIRWELGGGDSSPSLTLPVAPGSTLNPQSIVLACRAGAPWSPPDSGAGTWNAKPLVDGTNCVNGVIADDLSSVGFGLQPLVSGNVLDVVLTPGKETAVAPPAGVPEPPVDIDRSTFRWTFPAPDTSALTIVEGDFTEGAGDKNVSPAPVEIALPSDGAPAPEVPPATTFEAPAPTAPPIEPIAAPALADDELATAAPVIRPAASLGTGANRTIGFVFLVLAAAMAGWAYWSDRRDGAALLGVDGSAQAVGGLSRFARPRTGSPTPLS